MENLETANRPIEPPVGPNTTAKDDLLRRARSAIDAGEHSFHEAAEALVIAKELHGAKQAEMAQALDKSEAWVSLLLKWHRSGDKDQSPFGPTTKAECQSASDRDPGSASKRDPPFLRFERLALAPSELVGVAETGRARVGV